MTLIFTYIRTNIVDDILCDDEDREIIIKQPGGRIGTLTLAVEGTAAYKVGETNVLFLFTDPENTAAFQTVGMYRGKYRVYTSADGVTRVTQDGAPGVTLYKRAGSAAAIETGNTMPLDEFKRLILKYRSGN